MASHSKRGEAHLTQFDELRVESNKCVLDLLNHLVIGTSARHRHRIAPRPRPIHRKIG